MSLHLDARQRAMLAEMGIRAWSRPVPDAPSDAAPADAIKVKATAVRAPLHVKVQDRTDPPVVPARVAAPPTRPMVSTPASPSSDRHAGPSAAQTVFVGAGHAPADWMAFIDAPHQSQSRASEPFASQAEQLLEQMLAAIGLTRQSEVAMDSVAASACSASAGGKKDSKNDVYVVQVRKSDVPHGDDAQAGQGDAHETDPQRLIEQVKPRIILAMGRLAAQSLLATTEPLGRLRARVHQCHGAPLIVTYDPSYLLHARHDKAKAWQDLCLALQTFKVFEASVSN